MVWKTSSIKLWKGRKELEDECWDYVGESGKRIVDYLIEKRSAILGMKEKELCKQ